MEDSKKRMRTNVAEEDLFFAGTSQIITLNVGGKVFQTVKETFSTPHSGEYFKNLLFSDRYSKLKDDAGNIFIDRDPDLFQHILEYLRTDQVYSCDINFLKRLYAEANYYQLPSMQQTILDFITPTIRYSKVPWVVYLDGFAYDSGKREIIVIPFHYSRGHCIVISASKKIKNRFGDVIINHMEKGEPSHFFSFEDVKMHIEKVLVPAIFYTEL